MNETSKSGFYPYQASIDAYGNGGFRFADMSHQGSIVCLPSGMHAWPVSAPGELNDTSLQLVWDIADQLDVVFLGMGEDVAAIDPQLRAIFKDRSIMVEAVSTASAISIYNILLAEHRAVGAALIAVERHK